MGIYNYIGNFSIDGEGDGKEDFEWMIPRHRLGQISRTGLLPKLPENGPKSPKKKLLITG